MARFEQPGEILKRALAYPYAAPERSFLQVGGRAVELSGEELERAAAGTAPLDRAPLLAYGANAAPEALARKLAPSPDVPLPVLRAELKDFDVVYSAHVSPYGAVPATLYECAGVSAPVFVLYPTGEQRRLLAVTEPNYELRRLAGIELRLDPEATVDVGPLLAVDAFLSRHGCLSFSGDAPVALAAIRSVNRSFEEMDEPAVLERVRAHHAPDRDLEAFVVACVEAGGIAPLPESRPL